MLWWFGQCVVRVWFGSCFRGGFVVGSRFCWLVSALFWACFGGLFWFGVLQRYIVHSVAVFVVCYGYAHNLCGLAVVWLWGMVLSGV